VHFEGVLSHTPSSISTPTRITSPIPSNLTSCLLTRGEREKVEKRRKKPPSPSNLRKSNEYDWQDGVNVNYSPINQDDFDATTTPYSLQSDPHFHPRLK
jgi:hypothetical protein